MDFEDPAELDPETYAPYPDQYDDGPEPDDCLDCGSGMCRGRCNKGER